MFWETTISNGLGLVCPRVGAKGVELKVCLPLTMFCGLWAVPSTRTLVLVSADYLGEWRTNPISITCRLRQEFLNHIPPFRESLVSVIHNSST